MIAELEKVTLIIPTVFHRAQLLKKTLAWLEKNLVPSKIILSDHSPLEERGVIRKVVSSFVGLNTLLINQPPEMHFLQRIVCGAECADTKYVHLHADDDFIVPSTLNLLLSKLETDEECSAALGVNAHLRLDNREVRYIYKASNLVQDPLMRLFNQLENYSSVLYGLRRKDELIKTLNFSLAKCPDVQFWQYLESCIAVLEGKVVFESSLHYVRGLHPQKWSGMLVRDRSPDHFPWSILSPDIAPRIKAFRNALIEACKNRNLHLAESELDSALIRLLYRGFGAMGMPPLVGKNSPLDSMVDAEDFYKRARDKNDAINQELMKMLSTFS